MKRASSPRYAVITVIAGALLLNAIPALSHHSASAVFTDEDIVVEGYVTRFFFKNPHVSIYINVVDDNGVATEWMATGPATPSLSRQGWSRDMFKEGQYLRISGKKSRNNRPMVLLLGGEISSGRAIVELDPSDNSVVRVVDRNADRGNQVPSGRRESSSGIVAPPLTLADGRPNLSGTWFGGLKAAITDQTTPPLNDLGTAIQAEFDPINDPEYSDCSNQPGLVRQAVNFLPKRITQNDDSVIFDYEGFGARRVIALNGKKPGFGEHTAMGHHVARYEGNALVIETTRLLGNLTSVGGNALSDQTTTVETYRRIDTPESGAVLEMVLVVTDPGHLTEPWMVITHMTYDPDYQFAGTDCQLPLLGPEEAAARQQHN